MKIIIGLVLTCFTSLIISQNVIRGPYLQSPTDSKIHIKWRTDVATESYLWYGTSPSSLLNLVSTAALVENHEVILTNLQPFTTYYYAIGNQNGIISQGANYHFKTSPTIGTVQPIRTWVIGDFGKGNQSQLDVMNSYLDFNCTNHTDVWMWLGDNAYQDGTDTEYQNNVFNQYDSIMPYMPFFPTPGNHDYNSMNGYNILLPTLHTAHNGAFYDIVTAPTNGEIGGFPSGTEAFYSYEYANVHYICLNSEIQNTNSRNTVMEDWLTQDLAQNTKDWTIVYFHQAPYSKGSHDSDDIWEVFMRGIRKNILPILDAGGVDLVLSGHSHNYERSYLMKGHYDYSSTIQPSMFLNTTSGNPDEGNAYKKYYNGSNCDYEGIVYCVMGNSGSKTSPGDDEGLNHPVMYISDGEDAVGSLILDIYGDTLTGTYIRSSGAVIDKFQMQRVNGCNFTSVEENTPETEQSIIVKVFSDYKTGEFRIRFDITEQSPVTIQLFDMNGRVVYQKDFGVLPNGAHYHTIDTESLGISTGVYNFLIQNENSSVSKKVFKIN